MLFTKLTAAPTAAADGAPRGRSPEPWQASEEVKRQFRHVGGQLRSTESRAVAVTSSEEKAGVTSVACLLACALAEAGESVILGDLTSRQEQLRLFGVHRARSDRFAVGEEGHVNLFTTEF